MARTPETGDDRRLRLARPAVWLLHHREALTATWDRLRAERLGTALVVLTIGIALALPGLLYVAVERLGSVAERWDGTPRINVFLAAGDHGERIAAMRALGDVADVVYQSPEASLAELMSATGVAATLGALLGDIGDDPLPAVAIVTPTAEAAAPARLRALATHLSGLPGVDGVQVDLEWLQRLQALLTLLERLSWGLAALLASAVLLVVASLTRMAVAQRQDEIRVLKLVGGSAGFVLRPFLYQGVLLGLAGGLAAVLLLALALAFFGVPVAELARSYGSDFRLGTVPPALGGLLVLGGAVLGWLGAWATARRHLRAIEP